MTWLNLLGGVETTLFCCQWKSCYQKPTYVVPVGSSLAQSHPVSDTQNGHEGRVIWKGQHTKCSNGLPKPLLGYPCSPISLGCTSSFQGWFGHKLQHDLGGMKVNGDSGCMAKPAVAARSIFSGIQALDLSVPSADLHASINLILLIKDSWEVLT